MSEAEFETHRAQIREKLVGPGGPFTPDQLRMPDRGAAGLTWLAAASRAELAGSDGGLFEPDRCEHTALFTTLFNRTYQSEVYDYLLGAAHRNVKRASPLQTSLSLTRAAQQKVPADHWPSVTLALCAVAAGSLHSWNRVAHARAIF